MYVKMVNRDSNAVPSDEIHETGGAPVSFGTYWFDEPSEIGKDRDYLRIWRDAFFVHVFGIEGGPDREDAETGFKQWELKYAHWDHPDTGAHLAVTSGQIYLLSDNGTTIDRVRSLLG